jgi:hypothetical protein
MYGLYNGSQASENLLQGGLTRHQILQVNCGFRLNVGWNEGDSSGMAGANPNFITAGSINSVTPKGVEGGPHFVMSKETPDGSKTYGLEFAIIEGYMAGYTNPASATGGFDVTLWCLISNTQSPKPVASASKPVWACLQTLTAVNSNSSYSPELIHTFDINAQAIRFEIGNLDDDPDLNSKSIMFAMAEL